MQTTKILCLTLLTVLTGRSQNSFTGIAQGTVVDNAGAPIPSAQLTFRRISKYIGPLRNFMLAPGETIARGVIASDSQGKFTLGSLPVGDYQICAYSASVAYLDPCRWQSGTALTITGSATANLQIILKKGVFVNVRIKDPTGILQSAPLSPLKSPALVFGIKFGNGAFLGPETVVSNADGRIYQMAVPTGIPLNLWLYSNELRIADAAGNLLPARGAIIPFETQIGQNYSAVFTIVKDSQASR